MLVSGPPGLPHGAGSRAFCLIFGSQSGTACWSKKDEAASFRSVEKDGRREATQQWKRVLGRLRTMHERHVDRAKRRARG